MFSLFVCFLLFFLSFFPRVVLIDSSYCFFLIAFFLLIFSLLIFPIGFFPYWFFLLFFFPCWFFLFVFPYCFLLLFFSLSIFPIAFYRCVPQIGFRSLTKRTDMQISYLNNYKSLLLSFFLSNIKRIYNFTPVVGQVQIQ